MRPKRFSAANMGQAMADVRKALGETAYIVSTYESQRGRGTTVNARQGETRQDNPSKSTPERSLDGVPDWPKVAQALAFHRTPPQLAKQLLSDAQGFGEIDPALALAGALDARFRFERFPESSEVPVMLVGPPGSGKTVTAVKLAARHVIAGRPVNLITTDSVRSGAFEQLAAFAHLMDCPLRKASSPDELAAALSDAEPNALVIIDTPGTNSLNAAELKDLRGFVDRSGASPILVMAAGGDPFEAVEVAESFAGLGALRLHATRLDAARRLGSLLAAGGGRSLAFCEVSVTPFVANGLSPINPVSLARILLRAAPAPDTKTAASEKPNKPA